MKNDFDPDFSTAPMFGNQTCYLIENFNEFIIFIKFSNYSTNPYDSKATALIVYTLIVMSMALRWQNMFDLVDRIPKF